MKKAVLGILLAVFLFGGFLIVQKVQDKKTTISAQVLPGTYQLAVFNLVGIDGQPVTKQSFEGKWTVLTLGFTQCPDACPTALAYFRGELNKLTAEDKKELQFMMVTVDPERDTPDRLKQYVKGFHEDMNGATGDIAEITKLATSLMTHFRKEPEHGANLYMMAHSPRYYLINPKAEICATYDPPVKPGQLAADLKTLKSNSQGFFF